MLSRGDYHWQHEPCWYAVKKTGKGHWAGDRKQTTLWQIANKDQDAETVHGTQKPVECMRRPILNNSSPGQAIYGMTKAGLQGLIRSMAIEWAPHRIRVNGLSPTTTDTPLAKEWLDSDPALRENIARTVPLGRMAEPEDFFATLDLLLGDGARFITGQTLFVDGGVSVTHPLIKR